jgi:hypothetical protein
VHKLVCAGQTQGLCKNQEIRGEFVKRSKCKFSKLAGSASAEELRAAIDSVHRPAAPAIARIALLK